MITNKLFILPTFISYPINDNRLSWIAIWYQQAEQNSIKQLKVALNQGMGID